MPIQWNAEMDQKLLLAILKTHPITIDHSKVADELGTTSMSIQKRLQKIRDTLKKGGSDAGTPKPKSGKRKTGNGDGEDGESPTKKTKSTPKSSKKNPTSAAPEDGDDEEVSVKGVKQEQVDGDDDFN